ncbi:hypothetical protein CQW49_23125 (plasmid) [Methylosinus trichosporium OB3b]|uniref:Heme-binding protein n=1 Tax=Methylosinus trichosporium (strain ATCC 35070 / NCIMB 11131 / UNIQEM 75 / OB3b) TaxID=595536 RepID=A0A2D2D755_METT3|nr:heme-binding protein [Methylosinus trichosporium]ATQ70850.1 hypothetical protein CQW49_23125 [Methylosinus trichosporium OB3b]
MNMFCEAEVRMSIGVLIKAQGQPVGAIGVSGAPLSAEDEVCAKLGIAKVQGKLDAPR